MYMTIMLLTSHAACTNRYSYLQAYPLTNKVIQQFIQLHIRVFVMLDYD